MSKRTFVMCLTVGVLTAPFLGGAALASEQSQSPEATYTKKMARPTDPGWAVHSCEVIAVCPLPSVPE